MKNKKFWIGLLTVACTLTSALALCACGGANGKDGKDGKSAYEIWLENGHTGTEEDFLLWLKGDNEEKGTLGLHYQRIAGKDEYRVIGLGIAAELDIVIPDTYNGLPVTEIGVRAFENSTYITSIEIPNSVTTIGDYAFEDCSRLTSIEIPDSVTSIGSSAFSGCSSLTEMTLPFVGGSRKNASDTYQYPFGYVFGTGSYKDSVATTQYYYGSSLSSDTPSTYYIPTSLKRVTITSGNILYGAFKNCSSLTSVVIGDSVTTIGHGAFKNCSSLTSVVIGDSVTTIGGYAFSYCDSLTSVVIGDSVTTISGAFAYCSSLTSVYITDIEAWCAISFEGDYANPLYYAKNLYLNNELVTELTIPNTVTEIKPYAFAYCDSLTRVVIGDSVTTIGSRAFEDCSSLTSIEIPNSVTTIGAWAFEDCDSLTSVYYKGTASEWEEMSIGSNNSKLTSATRYYYSESEPTGTGNYWHYDTDGKTVVVW